MQLTREELEEWKHLIARLTLIALIHYFIALLVPNTKIATYTSVLLTVSTFSQTRMFIRLRDKLNQTISLGSGSSVPLGKTTTKGRMDLMVALNDIKMYIDRSKANTDRKRQLFKTMTWRQQDIVSKATDYPKKLNKIDKCVTENYKLLRDINQLAVQRHHATPTELRMAIQKAKTMRYNDHYRVIESLCHFSRDWSDNIEEIKPILDYITKNIEANIDDKSKTVVVAPGSGLGRVSHHIAESANFHSVISVEYSWLMILFNEFMYSKLKPTELSQGTKNYQIYPYIHNHSNHTLTENQFRSVDIQQIMAKPDNLHIERGDFTNFDIEDHFKSRFQETPENIVIVTCFFLDTAENLMDYMDSINKMASKFKGKKIWINCGPLKYGTAAKIELSYEELKNLRSVLGWSVLDELEDPKLLGYLTDLKGLWQGYYGVTMFTCELDK